MKRLIWFYSNTWILFSLTTNKERGTQDGRSWVHRAHQQGGVWPRECLNTWGR